MDDLRGHVTELTNVVELMHKAFSGCRDRLSATLGISPDALEDLRQTSLQFDGLRRTVRSSEEDPPPEKASIVHQASPKSGSPEEPQQHSTEVRNVPSWLDETALQHARKQAAPQDVGMGYTMYIPEDEELAQLADASKTVPGQKQQELAVFDGQATEEFRTSPSLSPPKTYSFQESTFGRRLHRACLEAGYHLLHDQHTKPQTYERVFKLSQMGHGKSKISAALKAMLARGPHESLDFWEAPLIHVGGAGTHYPRRDQYGNPQPRKLSYNLGLIGPQTLALLEDAARNSLSTDMTVEVAGYEGEWFDPYDVEGYLEEKGIHIDPSSSFAEAEIEDPISPSSSSTLSSGRSPATSYAEVQLVDPSTTFDAEQTLQPSLLDGDTDTMKWDDLVSTTLSGVGYSDALTGSWMNFLEPGQGANGVGSHQTSAMLPSADWDTAGTVDLMQESSPNALNSSFLGRLSQPAKVQARKKSIILDVAKFIKST